MSVPTLRRVVVGRIAGMFGVRGWVRVRSYTDTPENILKYGPWLVGDAAEKETEVIEGRAHGRGIVARLAGIDDRDMARELIGRTIRVPRDRFQKPGRNMYYWSDLIGLQVRNQDGTALGLVDDLLATGANDVLVIRGDRRRLVPFVMDEVVLSVDMDKGVINVAWDPDF